MAISRVMRSSKMVEVRFRYDSHCFCLIINTYSMLIKFTPKDGVIINSILMRSYNCKVKVRLW